MLRLRAPSILTGAPTVGSATSIKVKQAGVWSNGNPYVKVGGQWKKGTAYVKQNGAWRPGV